MQIWATTERPQRIRQRGEQDKWFDIEVPVLTRRLHREPKSEEAAAQGAAAHPASAELRICGSTLRFHYPQRRQSGAGGAYYITHRRWGSLLHHTPPPGELTTSHNAAGGSAEVLCCGDAPPCRPYWTSWRRFFLMVVFNPYVSCLLSIPYMGASALRLFARCLINIPGRGAPETRRKRARAIDFKVSLEVKLCLFMVRMLMDNPIQSIPGS